MSHWTFSIFSTLPLILIRYPSDRQIIYLDVAKPKALIIIEKASQEAGELPPQVRSYVSDNLSLKTEIPALALQDNGTLTGGQRGGQDVLSPQTQLANQLPGLTIGPDDIPTLSFTSGSEGRPKGKITGYKRRIESNSWLRSSRSALLVDLLFPLDGREFWVN